MTGDEYSEPGAAWHALAVRDVVEALGTNAETGLDAGEVDRRRTRYGSNTLPDRATRRIVPLLLAQFKDVTIVLLIAAAAISAVVGEPQDVAAIGIIVVLNAALGFAQEYRAERALHALRGLAAPAARVRRGGLVSTIEARAIVPGDVVLLEAGDAVAADMRLFDVRGLTVDESLLTGESQPVAKVDEPVPAAELPLGERRDIAYQGTMVTAGRGSGIVIATGEHTELGRIAALLNREPTVPTPLQRRLSSFSTRIAAIAVGLCALILFLGLVRGEAPFLMFMTALSLAVAAIPEALPAVVTLSLAYGARRLARQRALIRSLPAVETLGSVTYICADKTGTLTRNRMEVQTIWMGAHGGPADRLAMLHRAIAVSNDVTLVDSEPRGDPTEVALYHAGVAAGYTKHALEASLPRLAEIGFTAERSRMTTVHRDGAGVVAFTKGAPEHVVALCTGNFGGGDAIDRLAALAEAERMAADGLRVLAIATRRFTSVPPDVAAIERELEFLGLVGLRDPLRSDAVQAVRECRSAGVHVVMITGDHPRTALAIARQLDLGAGEVMTGAELATIPDDELAARVDRVRVFARVTPYDKLRIVEALQARGEFVAMTGDGVNDAPSLRRADIGIAMGATGTDVAREAAAMVLLDDDFATIVRAVREGRRIYDNVRKFVRYILTGNSGEMWVLLLAPLIGLPLPLLPIHILWVNLVTDGLPALALTAEPAERDVMRRPPRSPREGLFAHGLWQHVMWAGLLLGAVTLGVQALAIRGGDAHWQTMTFTVLTLAQMGQVLSVSSEHDSMFRPRRRVNRLLLAAVAVTVALQLSTLYVPALARVFRTQPLTIRELGVTLGASIIVTLGVETAKFVRRRRSGVTDLRPEQRGR